MSLYLQEVHFLMHEGETVRDLAVRLRKRMSNEIEEWRKRPFEEFIEASSLDIGEVSPVYFDGVPEDEDEADLLYTQVLGSLQDAVNALTASLRGTDNMSHVTVIGPVCVVIVGGTSGGDDPSRLYRLYQFLDSSALMTQEHVDVAQAMGVLSEKSRKRTVKGAIWKTSICVSVLSKGPYEFLSLEGLVYDLNEGDCIGDAGEVTSSVPLADAEVEKELLAMGNDGTFFFDSIPEDEDDDDDEDGQ